MAIELSSQQKFQLEEMNATFGTVLRKKANDEVGMRVVTITDKDRGTKILEHAHLDEQTAVNEAIEAARKITGTPTRRISDEESLRMQVAQLTAQVNSLLAAQSKPKEAESATTEDQAAEEIEDETSPSPIGRKKKS